MSRRGSKKRKSRGGAETRPDAHVANPTGRPRRWPIWFGVAVGVAAIAAILWLRNPPSETESGPADSVVAAEIPDPDLTAMQPLVVERFRAARAAVVAAPQSDKAWGSFGAVCDAHFEYACAEPCYRRAIELAPDNGQWVYLLALVRRGQGTDLPEAERLLRRAGELLPTFPTAPYRLGQLLADQGRLADAKAAYQRALELNPRMAVAHDRLGRLLLATGDTPAAIRHMETARELVPNDRALLAALGQAYMRQGEREKAEVIIAESRRCFDTIQLHDPVYEAVASLAMSTTFLYQRAGALMMRGDFAKAIPELKAFADTYPDNATNHLNLALAYLKTRKKALAERHFATLVRLRGELRLADAAVSPLEKRLRQIDEGVVVYWAEYLELIIASGDKGELRRVLERFETQAGDLPITAGAQMAWANALAELGINDRAIEHYGDAIRLDPAFSNAYYNLGYLYEDIGRMDEAVVEYRRSAAVDPRGRGAVRLRELGIPLPPPAQPGGTAPRDGDNGRMHR